MQNILFKNKGAKPQGKLQRYKVEKRQNKKTLIA